MPRDASTQRYTSVAEIAAGGMGRVYLAMRQEGDFKRAYALKRLHPTLRTDEAFRSMFMDEARIAGLISHPNVVGVIDVGEDAQGPFLVMDYIEGVSVGQLLKRVREQRARVPVQIALRIAAAVARGLHAAHELTGHDGSALQLVHRDVSPQNVLLGFDGSVRVTDFGVAKALGRRSKTVTGTLKGKFGYMSPEQLLYQEPDRRSDLYSLGVVLFELLAARRLYANRDGAEGAREALYGPTPDIGDEREDVDDEVVSLLFSLLAKKPEKRPSTGHDVAMRLDMLIADLASIEGPLDIGEYINGLFADRRAETEALLRRGMAALDAPSSERRVMWPWLATAAGILLVAAGGYYFTTSADEPPAPSVVTDVPEFEEPPPAQPVEFPAVDTTTPEVVEPTPMRRTMRARMRAMRVEMRATEMRDAEMTPTMMQPDMDFTMSWDF